ncbi:LAME_0A03994g1_1 [Lachancea meyersii CBS 8951]|uniref:LAME_0A03994g1_1 n=1 Tax=Lachancea meyersii CBS 8951 TaxID=1266667 RepID=A0A1G4INQ2_9SACH|nr:LAME_0A03994g1_1 [Lachancea meyersii CBS 8951]
MILSNELTRLKLAMSVPSYQTFEDIPDRLQESYTEVIRDFKVVYGHNAEFVTRSPGRVNLIGDHIDYVDFSVLPMAIEHAVTCAVKVTPSTEIPSVTLTNSDSRFAQRRFDLPLDGSDISIDPSVSDWSNYFKCGLHVAQQYLKTRFAARFPADTPLAGLEVFVGGQVFTGGGLSSSAAFICAVALAVIRANTGHDFKMPKQELTQITAKAEHFVGVNNGGMDQAASVCGEVDHALYVEFKPELKATPFMFPKLKNSEIQFVIANTMVVSNKVETAPTNYNLRVVEVVVAANVLAAKYGVALGRVGNSEKTTLREFMDAYYARYHGATEPWNGDIEQGISRLTEMLKLVEDTLAEHSSGYTLQQASEAVNSSMQEFSRDYLTNFPVRFQVLKLYQRAKHVYSESLRVLEALKLMLRESFASDLEFFDPFGQLMNESQKSCDEMYECSCPEIDEICKIAKANGAYGSRLTGAGWGGCTVHLVPLSKVDDVREALAEQYYAKHDMQGLTLDDVVLVSRPALGSCIMEVGS